VCCGVRGQAVSPRVCSMFRQGGGMPGGQRGRPAARCRWGKRSSPRMHAVRGAEENSVQAKGSREARHKGSVQVCANATRRCGGVQTAFNAHATGEGRKGVMVPSARGTRPASTAGLVVHAGRRWGGTKKTVWRKRRRVMPRAVPCRPNAVGQGMRGVGKGGSVVRKGGGAGQGRRPEYSVSVHARRMSMRTVVGRKGRR